MKRLSTLFILATIAITGCATVAPGDSRLIAADKTERAGSPTIESVRKAPQDFANANVQWGGIVEKIEYRDDSTWVEVIGRPLNRVGQPQTRELSDGRFLAIVPEFLEPADYKTGSAITVTGTVEGVHTRPIGDTDTAYEFPKVATVDHQLWIPSTRLTRNGRSYASRYGYRPYRSNVSIGFGLGHRNSFRFGLSKGFKFGHFGIHGRRGHRGHNRGHFTRGHFKYF